MPVLTEEGAPEQRKRGSRRLWLLLVPPLLGLGMLTAAAVQPLQLGPYVVFVDVQPSQGFGWGPRALTVPGPLPGWSTLPIRNQSYVITGGGRAFALGFGDWLCGAAWFRGHRKR